MSYMYFIKCRKYFTLNLINKRQRILKGQTRMDNPEKLEKQGTQDTEKQNKNMTQYVLDSTTHKQTQIT